MSARIPARYNLIPSSHQLCKLGNSVFGFQVSELRLGEHQVYSKVALGWLHEQAGDWPTDCGELRCPHTPLPAPACRPSLPFLPPRGPPLFSSAFPSLCSGLPEADNARLMSLQPLAGPVVSPVPWPATGVIVDPWSLSSPQALSSQVASPSLFPHCVPHSSLLSCAPSQCTLIFSQ